ncbi:hypothetical protein [Streptosporangium sp. NPDC051022]
MDALKGTVITPAKSKIRPWYGNAPPRTVRLQVSEVTVPGSWCPF